MANFTPSGKVRIGRVPFDNSYRHTMTFASVADQTAFFSSCCNQAFEKDTYTYIRMNNAIRVQFNAEALYTYDYVMYQNANYGNKWFYAFIVGVNYINENTTELELELDVMQTWYFDYTLVQGFVEREHVNDDTVGVHLNPEPEMPFNLICKTKYRDPDFQGALAVVQTNATPHYGTDPLSPISPDGAPNGNEPVSGGIYSNCLSGCAFYAFYPDEPQQWDSSLYGFLRDMNRSGSAESISNIFLFPAHFLNGAHPDGSYSGDSANSNDSWKGYRVSTGMGAGIEQKQFSRPTSLDNGFVPHNNKLFTYPYCFARVEDNAGHYTEWKYELWAKRNSPGLGTDFTYDVVVPLDPDATAFVIPLDYDGESANYETCLTFPCTAKSSWNYSAYQTWSAQNHLANVFNGLASVAAIAIPAAKGISLASGALGVGVRSAGNIAARGGTPASAGNILKAAGEHALNSMQASDFTMMGGGALGLGNLDANISRQSKVPNTVRGSASGNSLYGINMMTYNIKAMVLQEEFARIIDGFFDMYGYQVDSVKVPNRTGRPYWNYVKMQNSCHRGNVPSDQMDKINRIYDTGITFWHTADVGNYSLDNTI